MPGRSFFNSLAVYLVFVLSWANLPGKKSFRACSGSCLYRRPFSFISSSLRPLSRAALTTALSTSERDSPSSTFAKLFSVRLSSQLRSLFLANFLRNLPCLPFPWTISSRIFALSLGGGTFTPYCGRVMCPLWLTLHSFIGRSQANKKKGAASVFLLRNRGVPGNILVSRAVNY